MRRWLIILACAYAGLAIAQNGQDLQRISEYDIVGTARYTAMSGAMTAVGGDPSAVLDNPAALGVYRRQEISITMGAKVDDTRAGDNSMVSNFIAPQGSFVFTLGGNDKSSGVISCSFMLGFNERKRFNRDSYIEGELSTSSLGDIMVGQVNGRLRANDLSNYISWSNPNVPWLATLGYNTYLISPVDSLSTQWETAHSGESFVPAMRCEEYGYVQDYVLACGLNISNKLYVGVGLDVVSTSYRKVVTYKEAYTADYLDLQSMTSMSGVGVSFSVGVIYKPISYLRLGISMNSPAIMQMKVTHSANMISSVHGAMSDVSSPENIYTQRNYLMPWRTTVGIAVQCSHYGMLSFEYDFQGERPAAYGMQNVHTLKIGTEWVVKNNLFFRAGYAYGSSFVEPNIFVLANNDYRTDAATYALRSAHYISGGIGYRSQWLMLEAAYQCRLQNVDVYAHANSCTVFCIYPISHEIVFTLAWHSARK